MNRSLRVLATVTAVCALVVGLAVSPASGDDASAADGGFLRQSFCAEVRETIEIPPGEAEVVGSTIGFDGKYLVVVIEVDGSPVVVEVSNPSGVSTPNFAVFATPGFFMLRLGDWVLATAQGFDPGILRFEARIVADQSTCEPPPLTCTHAVTSAECGLD